MKQLPLALVAGLSLLVASTAQQSGGQEDPTLTVELNNPPLWEWQGRDDSAYSVRVGAIQSVGLQNYTIINGGVRVVEMTVDTVGNVCARFYYVEAIGSAVGGNTGEAIERVTENTAAAAERVGAGVNPLDQVIKDYPETTHAHTVEYRLRSEAEVHELYSSIRESLEDGRGRRVRGN